MSVAAGEEHLMSGVERDPGLNLAGSLRHSGGEVALAECAESSFALPRIRDVRGPGLIAPS